MNDYWNSDLKMFKSFKNVMSIFPHIPNIIGDRGSFNYMNLSHLQCTLLKMLKIPAFQLNVVIASWVPNFLPLIKHLRRFMTNESHLDKWLVYLSICTNFCSLVESAQCSALWVFSSTLYLRAIKIKWPFRCLSTIGVWPKKLFGPRLPLGGKKNIPKGTASNG